MSILRLPTVSHSGVTQAVTIQVVVSCAVVVNFMLQPTMRAHECRLSGPDERRNMLQFGIAWRKTNSATTTCYEAESIFRCSSLKAPATPGVRNVEKVSWLTAPVRSVYSNYSGGSILSTFFREDESLSVVEQSCVLRAREGGGWLEIFLLFLS